MERRDQSFSYAADLVRFAVEALPSEKFFRRCPTFKGHFGAFDPGAGEEYRHLVSKLQLFSDQVLAPSNAIVLAETGCETADTVAKLHTDVARSRHYFCNWDIANLSLWNADEHTLTHGRKLAFHNLLRGVHFKGGKKPEKRGEWGTEVNPSEELIKSVLEVLNRARVFDGPLTVEREFFPGPRSARDAAAESRRDQQHSCLNPKERSMKRQ